MKQLFLVFILLIILFLSSCRRFKMDNFEIIEDPNQVVIIIDKGLK